MNVSTEPRHRPKTVQPVPDYDQDAKHVTEILVDKMNNRTKSILKNKGSHTTTPQSPLKDHPVNPIRARTIRSQTMNVAPDCHQHEHLTGRTTTEAVDLAQPTINTETTISRPDTIGIKRSLLLEPPFQISQYENEVEDHRPITTDTTNMQLESSPGAANDTPQQDETRSYPADQTAEYASQNYPDRGTLTPSPLPPGSPEMKSRTLHPSRVPQLTCNLKPPGVVNDTPTQDEPQSYPMDQIAEYLIKDPVTNEECISIFSAVTLKKKKKMLFALMYFQDLTLDALFDSGALVNCISETDYNIILQMSPKDIVKQLEPPPFKLQVANGEIETPTKTSILQFEIRDWNFKETFNIAKRLTGPIRGLTFLKNNSAILDVSQGLLHFPHLTYSIETDECTHNRKL